MGALTLQSFLSVSPNAPMGSLAIPLDSPSAPSHSPQFETDAEILAMLPEVKKLLQKTTPESKSFDDVTKVGVRKVFGKQVMSMDMLQDELSARRVTKEITVNPTPKVKGDVLKPRHCNLSWLDAKGAFTTAQYVREGRDTAEVLPRTELRTGERRARSDALPLTCKST
jgi:hypothetical protein